MSTRLSALAVFLAALAAGSIAVLAMGADSHLDADGPYFWSIAHSLAAGKGFVNPLSSWPDSASAERMPVWPILLTPAAWLSSSPAAARFTAVLFHALAAVTIFLLTRRLAGPAPVPALAAGLVAAFSPPSLYLCTSAMSELCLLALLGGGLLLILDPRRRYWGALLLGLAAANRANLLLLPMAAIVPMLLHGPTRRTLTASRAWVRIAVMVSIFALPLSAWIFRNWIRFSYFPLICSLEGEALYGANNLEVANNLEHWGYWVMPDRIPGQAPKRQLVGTMSELEVHFYYRSQAIAYLKSNWRALPRHILGKLVRGYVPLPWNPLAASYLAFLWRGLLDLLVLATVTLWWRRTDSRYLLLLGAMTAVNLFTTVLYYGVYRFTWPLAQFFTIPLVAVAYEDWRGERDRKRDHQTRAARA